MEGNARKAAAYSRMACEEGHLALQLGTGGSARPARSLEDVGRVLGLDEQKMKEGKELIRYFCVPCKPTRANGGRTRNLPCHAPEKWELFKTYCKRDVDVEKSIRRKLHNFPIPESEMELYRL